MKCFVSTRHADKSNISILWDWLAFCWFCLYVQNMNNYNDTKAGGSLAIFGVPNEKRENMNTDYTPEISTYAMPDDGVYVVHQEKTEYSKDYRAISIRDLSGGEMPDLFVLNVARLQFDETGELAEDDFRNERASIFVNRETLILLAHQIITRFGN